MNNSSRFHTHPAEHQTEEMARRYFAEGLPDRAAEICRQLLALHPGDAGLRELLLQAEAAIATARQGRLPPLPATDEPHGMLDLEELPEAYGIDECELIARDPFHLFAYWEVTAATLDAARHQLGDEGAQAQLILRLFLASGAATRELRDLALGEARGRRYLPAPKPGTPVRGAVGLLSPSGLFIPLAHSHGLRIPPSEMASPDLRAAWMEVAPARTVGQEREPVQIVRGPERPQPPERGPQLPRWRPGVISYSSKSGNH